MLRALLALLSLLAHAVAQSSPSCDNEAGQVYPMSVGKEVGVCLQDPSKHALTDIDGNPRELEPGEKPMELSEDCKAFIKINEVCDKEIEEHCEGQYFQGDTMTCLTQWKYDVLGDDCKGVLPKKEAESVEVDADKAAWRAKRKGARDAAIKEIEKDKKKKEDAAKKGKKRRKSKKEL
uniref:Uncharacterized protein n=1 Tax=Karlodinium veneficum TaxID=407301 RepID=A7WPZ7_KARVE|nr:unknown [Karlodinium veneficum]